MAWFAKVSPLPEPPSLLSADPPDGYRWGSMGDPFIPFICRTCGSSVAKSGVDLHDAWHARDGH